MLFRSGSIWVMVVETLTLSQKFLPEDMANYLRMFSEDTLSSCVQPITDAIICADFPLSEEIVHALEGTGMNDPIQTVEAVLMQKRLLSDGDVSMAETEALQMRRNVESVTQRLIIVTQELEALLVEQRNLQADFSSKTDAEKSLSRRAREMRGIVETPIETLVHDTLKTFCRKRKNPDNGLGAGGERGKRRRLKAVLGNDEFLAAQYLVNLHSTHPAQTTVGGP